MNSTMKENIGKGAIILLILVFLIPAFAVAAPRGDWGGGKKFGKKRHQKSPCSIWRNPALVETLELTDQQVKDLRDADFAFREKRLQLKSRIDTLRLKMYRAFTEETVDDQVILQLAEKISKVKGKMFVQKIKSRLALKKLLSAEQLRKLKAWRFQKRGKFGKRHAMGRRHMALSQKHMQTHEAY